MRKLLSTLAVAALLAGYAGGAQATEGWYGRADIGYSTNGEAPVDTFYDYYEDKNTGPQAYQSEWFSGQVVDLDDGWMADAGLGYAFENGFRAEAELAQRVNEIENSSFLFSSDNVYATSAMLNGFYDFNREGQISPYVGIGVGWAKVAVGEDDDTKLAWQAMAGLGVALSERMTLDIGYRHFETDDLDYASVEAGYQHEAVTLGLRYQFAAAAPMAVAQAAPPPPPPPPPPVVCPTSEFVVYFEWDRSDLNQAAMATIDQAVARARQCNVSAVAIVGHTDASGSNAYNMGLSERRAVIVRDALVGRGMAASLMSLAARGEAELARQTRDGVREPLNRRTAVTIIFR